MESTSLVLLIIGGILLMISLTLLIAARIADQRNYIIQKATPMPLSLINERDDVWLRGIAECSSPLRSPHFGTACLYFEYKLEERVTRTVTDSDGKTRIETSWKTREQTKQSTQFWLQQADLKISIDGNQAKYKHLAKKTDRIGDFRHSVRYLPYPVEMSAVGSVSERKAQLEPYANIPLLITTQQRSDFIKSAEKTESILRLFGFLCLWLAGVSGFYVGFDQMGWPVETRGQFSLNTLLVGIGFATLVVLIFWTIYFFNTFVVYNQRVKNAWRQIDVDLKMRSNLIPQLVEATKAYLQHEKALLESIAKLRNQTTTADQKGKIVLETEMAYQTQNLIALLEKYPQAVGQPLITKLTREMRAIEEKIAHGRSFYNDTVKEYNDIVLVMPRGLVARLFGYKTKPMFEIESLERQVPKL